MILYYLMAFLNGLLNTVNRMINVRAGKTFGTLNGSLINYFEATVISLGLIFLIGKGNELSPSHLSEVPLWVYLGSIAGLIAQLLQIVGTLKTNATVSTILCLVGNLGTAVILDYFFFDIFSWWKILGIALILAGTAQIELAKEKGNG